MSIDKLQEKIRKLKTPLVVDFSVCSEHIPDHIRNKEESFMSAYHAFGQNLLMGLKNLVPAVRFDFNTFAVFGAEGMTVLEELLRVARGQGYYIFLDGVQALSAQSASTAANMFLSRECRWDFDGLVLSSYIGSDGFRPYVSLLKESGKDLFVVIRTSNKSATELQDLLAGGRLVHMANADIVNRYTGALVGKSGYSQLAIVAAASSADSLRSLRSKYKNMFMLLDGYDYPNSNAKNCSYAFDELGRGAAACAGISITAAWRENETDGLDFVDQAVAAVERAKKNLLRYLTIL